jgi:hypothetical protein
MKQSKLMSLVEAIVSILVGFGISLAAQAVFLPLLGVEIAFHQNLIFALIMTAISIARQFVMRRIFEALHIRRPLSPFMQAVVAERFRQVEMEGFSTEHDDKHARGVLASAGAVYALNGRVAHVDDPGGRGATSVGPMAFWPWDSEWWKPQDHRRNLVKAAALILAEGERFDRQRLQRRPA